MSRNQTEGVAEKTPKRIPSDDRPPIPTTTMVHEDVKIPKIPDIEQFIAEVLPCIDEGMGGRNDTTLQRRQAIARFFDCFVVLVAPVSFETSQLVERLTTVLQLFTGALVRMTQRDTHDVDESAVRDDLLEVIGRLHPLAVQLLQNSTAPWADAEVNLPRRALEDVFDWESPARLRAYVYASTGEILKEGLLGKERFLFQQAVLHCIGKERP